MSKIFGREIRAEHGDMLEVIPRLLGVKITHVTKVITAKGTAEPRKPRVVRPAAE